MPFCILFVIFNRPWFFTKPMSHVFTSGMRQQNKKKNGIIDINVCRETSDFTRNDSHIVGQSRKNHGCSMHLSNGGESMADREFVYYQIRFLYYTKKILTNNNNHKHRRLIITSLVIQIENEIATANLPRLHIRLFILHLFSH